MDKKYNLVDFYKHKREMLLLLVMCTSCSISANLIPNLFGKLVIICCFDIAISLLSKVLWRDLVKMRIYWDVKLCTLAISLISNAIVSYLVVINCSTEFLNLVFVIFTFSIQLSCISSCPFTKVFGNDRT